MIPHENIKKWYYSFTGQDKHKSDSVKIANIITSTLFVIVFAFVIFSFLTAVVSQRQNYDIEIELKGNITMPDYIHGFENITFDYIKIKGKADMPVYILRGLT